MHENELIVAITINGNEYQFAQVNSKDFSLQVSKENPTVVVVREDGNRILIRSKKKTTRLTNIEDDEELEDQLGNNALARALTEDSKKSDDDTIEFDTKDYNKFCEESPLNLEELVEISLNNINRIKSNKLLKTINILAAHMLSYDYILAKMLQMDSAEIVELVDSESPYETFIELTT